MKWLLKKITVPATNETKETNAIQLWEVRWWSLHGVYACGGDSYDETRSKEELEAFPTEQEAIDFALALTNAFALTRRTFRTKPKIIKTR